MSLTSEQIQKLGEIIERAFKPFFEFAKEVQKTTDVDQLWTSLESATPEDFESNPEILIDGDGCAIKPIKEIHKSLLPLLEDDIFLGNVDGMGNTLSTFWTQFWVYQLNNCDDEENDLLKRVREEKIGKDGILNAVKNDIDSAERILEVNGEEIAKVHIDQIAPFDQWNWREFRNRLVHSKICRGTRTRENDRNRDDLPEFLLEALYSPGYWKAMASIKIVHGHISKCYLALESERLSDSRNVLEDCLKIFLAEAREGEKEDNRWSSDRQVMLEGLKALDWQPGEHYVECLHKPLDGSRTTTAIGELTRVIGEGGGVAEIHGVGGVGKTILAYRYVWDNLMGIQKFHHIGLDRTVEVKPYRNIVFLSSKGKDPDRQGKEFNTTPGKERLEHANTLSQRMEKISSYYYGFDTFLRKVGYQVEYQAGESESERAWRALTTKRFLVVIDNFEDYHDKNTRRWNQEGERFKRFLDNYHEYRGKASIIVTSRTSLRDDVEQKIPTIIIDGLDNNDLRFSLVQKRAEYLARRNLAPVTNRMTALYLGRADSSSSMADFNEQRTAWRNLENKMGKEFQNNLTQPMIIMILTNELMNKLVDPNIADIDDAVKEICSEDNAEGKSTYLDAIRDHDEWSMERAISKHVGDGKLISTGIVRELYMKYPNYVFEEDLSRIFPGEDRDRVFGEIKNIYADAILIERQSDTETRRMKVKLKHGAKRELGRKQVFPELDLEEGGPRNAPALSDHERILIIEEHIQNKDFQAAFGSLEDIVERPNIATRTDLDPENIMRATRIAKTLGDHAGGDASVG